MKELPMKDVNPSSFSIINLFLYSKDNLKYTGKALAPLENYIIYFDKLTILAYFRTGTYVNAFALVYDYTYNYNSKNHKFFYVQKIWHINIANLDFSVNGVSKSTLPLLYFNH